MKIGITIDLSIAFWANGAQQNIVFLNHLLSSSRQHECFYIADEDPNHKLNKGDGSIMIDNLMRDKSIKLDVLIVAGCMLPQYVYDELKKRNKNIKIILIHCFNKLMDDIHYTINHNDISRNPEEKPRHLSQIWILPHHDFSIEYIKAYYNFNEVREVPYLWNSFFVDQKLEELTTKNQTLQFQSKDVNRVCIFEPNFSHIKNCIIPLMICEKFQQLFPGELQSVNVFSCEKLREKQFFGKFVKRLSLIKDSDGLCFFNNRWSTLAGLSRWGNTVVSHQMNNSLNYAHLEVLYLGLPLVHNSHKLMDLGYYYPDFDIDMAAKQLKNAILNHSQTIIQYKNDVRRELEKFSPHYQSNIDAYNNLLNE